MNDENKIQSELDLETDIHDNLSDLDEDISQMESDNEKWIKNSRTLYYYYNLRSTLSKEEQDKLGRKEMINFGDSFETAQTFTVPVESMTLNTNTLPNVKFDTNNLERDTRVSAIANKLFAHIAFNNTSKFDNFWRTVAGWSFLRAGGACVWDNKYYGLYPRFADSMLFPTGSSLIPAEMTRCCEELHLDLADLKNFHNEAEDKYKKPIKKLIEDVKKQMGSKSQYDYGDAEVKTEVSTRKDGLGDVFTAWKYWEVRQKKDGSKYVSSITYAKCAILGGEEEQTESGYTLLDQEEEALDHPSHWMEMICVDEEVGGNKTVDTMRGLGEAGYKPSVAKDTLKNRQYEGALIASRPLFFNESGKKEEILGFDPTLERIAPKGLGVLEIPDTSRALDKTIAYLDNGVSKISRSDTANSGGGQNLLAQVKQINQSTQVIVSNRIAKFYKHLDRIIALMFRRIMTLDLSSKEAKGTDDYDIIVWFQKAFDEELIKLYNIEKEFNTTDEDNKAALMKLAKKKRLELAEEIHGIPKYYTVKANRNATGLDRMAEEETGRILIDAVKGGIIPPIASQEVLKTAMVMITQNEDVASLAFEERPVIDRNERFIARTEYEHIKNLALAGEHGKVSINDSDVHYIHVDEKLNMMIAEINEHGINPWTQDKLIKFSAVSDHVGDHMAEMRRDPSSQGLVNQYFQEWQGIIKQVAIIVQELSEQQLAQEQEGSLEDELTKAKISKLLTETKVMIEQHGLKIEEHDRLDMQTRLRQFGQGETRELAKRKQAFKEIMDIKRFNKLGK